MVELATVIAALRAYRARLKARGNFIKAMAVGRCIEIVRALRSRLVRALRDIGGLRQFNVARLVQCRRLDEPRTANDVPRAAWRVALVA